MRRREKTARRTISMPIEMDEKLNTIMGLNFSKLVVELLEKHVFGEGANIGLAGYLVEDVEEKVKKCCEELEILKMELTEAKQILDAAKEEKEKKEREKEEVKQQVAKDCQFYRGVEDGKVSCAWGKAIHRKKDIW